MLPKNIASVYQKRTSLNLIWDC